MRTRTVSHFAELVGEVNQFAGKRKFLWRGHANSQWGYNSSLKRFFDSMKVDSVDDRKIYERECISELLSNVGDTVLRRPSWCLVLHQRK